MLRAAIRNLHPEARGHSKVPRPGNPRFPFPRFPIRPGNGEGISDSRLGREREPGNPPFPDSAGKRESGSRLAANRRREIGDTLPCEYSTGRHDPGLDVALSPSNCGFCVHQWRANLASESPQPLKLPFERTRRWRMPTRTRRWRTMGRTFRTMSTETLMPRHSRIGNQIPRLPVCWGDFPIPDWPGIGNRGPGAARRGFPGLKVLVLGAYPTQSLPVTSRRCPGAIGRTDPESEPHRQPQAGTLAAGRGGNPPLPS